MPLSAHEKLMLLCRTARSIQDNDNEKALLQLKKLTDNLFSKDFISQFAGIGDCFDYDRNHIDHNTNSLPSRSMLPLPAGQRGTIPSTRNPHVSTRRGRPPKSKTIAASHVRASTRKPGERRGRKSKNTAESMERSLQEIDHQEEREREYELLDQYNKRESHNAAIFIAEQEKSQMGSDIQQLLFNYRFTGTSHPSFLSRNHNSSPVTSNASRVVRLRVCETGNDS